MTVQPCVRCRMPTESMLEIPADVGSVLRKCMSPDSFFRKVCPDCLEQLQAWKADPNLVTNRMAPSEFKKLMQWSQRSEMIRQGVALFRARNYEESMIKYEEYIQIVEQVFGTSRQALTQKHFEDANKGDELAIYNLVLWDLFVMDDGKNPERQEKWAAKLTELSAGLPLRSTLLQQMKAQERKLKNRVLIKKMMADFGEGGCFVATYAFGDPEAVAVQKLRLFRDQRLARHRGGMQLVRWYYRWSPVWVTVLRRCPGQALIRRTLRGILGLVVGPLTLGLSRRTLPHGDKR